MLKIIIGIVLLDWAASSSPEFLALNRLSPEEDLQRQQQCGSLPGPVRKVLNGDLVTNYTFAPYTVGILQEYDRIVTSCSATLISKRHILTAAHCIRLITDNFDCSTKYAVANIASIEFHLRTTCIPFYRACEKNKDEKGGIVVRAKNIILPFPYYSRKCNIRNRDIMIVELEKDIVNEEDVEFACLSTDQLHKCEKIRITGFGRDTNHTTNQPLSGILKTYETTTADCNGDDRICAANYDMQSACGGDSGSGAIKKSSDAKNQVQGVVVAGTAECQLQMEDPDKFREKPAFTIITQTKVYLDWICFVTGICPREQDREMVSDYLNNETASHPDFFLLQQIQLNQ